MKLMRTLILRPLVRDPLRTVLTILAVALGVAVVIAIELAGEAATGSFQSSLETVAGKTDLEIYANGGVDEGWIGRLSGLPFEAHFSPLMEARALVTGAGAFPLYGVDAVGGEKPNPAFEGKTQADGLVVSRAMAERLGLAEGGVLEAAVHGHPHRFPILTVVDAGAPEFAALDIAEFERLTGRYGKLDRIDVTVAPGENLDAVEKAVRRQLPPGYFFAKPGARAEENQRMLRAFRLNLRVLSYVSLVVGAFLIYNTIAVSVVRRRAEIGILRAIGASRSTVVGLFLAEAALLGVAGAALGILFGHVLAKLILGMIAQTVNALYTTSRPAPIAFAWWELWLGLATGLAVAVASALAPALETLNVTPTEAMSRGAHEHRARLRWRVWLAAAGVMAAVSFELARLGSWHGFPAAGYAAAFTSIAAAALAAPALVLGVERATRRLLGARVETLLAGRSLTASLARTSVIVSALATAIAMMVSVGIMVGSFRETVVAWLDVQLRADLFVSPAGRGGADDYTPLPGAVSDLLRSIPGVAAVDPFHAVEIHYRGQRALLGGTDASVSRRYGRLRFLAGQDRGFILASLAGRNAAIVSEPFANKHGIEAGRRFTLALGSQDVSFLVAGIFYDYGSSQGLILIDGATLLHYLPSQPVTSAAAYLSPGANAAAVRREIERRVAGLDVTVLPTRLLRDRSVAVFDRTFAITWALEAVAIVVAMLGAANSLLALVLDRRRELGLLRFLGASTGQIRGMILAEAGLLGLFAALLGMALGLALSLLLIFVVNKQSFGWTIQFHPPGGLLAGALAIIWLVTALAALYPARVASKLRPVEAIHEE
jgi:putative ABC transport system permease protein